MRIKLYLVTLIVLAMTAMTVGAQSNTFTYQGRLTDNNLAAVGTYEMQFRVFDAAIGGNQLPIGTPVTLNFTVAGTNPVTVSNGAFTVQLNFGSGVFTGADRWLDISVRKPSDPPGFTLLTPRQPITSSPYAIKTINAVAADSVSAACVLCITDAQISGIDGGKVTGTVASALTATSAVTANNVSGIVAIANGGTGSATKNFVDLTTTQTVGGDKTFTGILAGNGSGLTNVPGTFKWNEVTGLTQQAVSNNGYVTSNATQATVTLPASPNVGDTVRITAGGFGGFKIAQNAGQSVNGFYYGTVGLNWVPRETVRNWTGIASSADGEKLVAVVSGGQIYTSTNAGVTWTPRETARGWSAVASSADGQKLLAAAQGGQLYTSTDGGVNWTPRDSDRNWWRVASSADGVKLAAVEINGFTFTSDDSGVTWTQRHVFGQWTGIAMSSDGQRMLATRTDGVTRAYISTDGGVNWAATGVPIGVGVEPAAASSADGTKLFVSGGSATYSSINSGSTWVQSTFTPATPLFTFGLASSADGSRVALAAASAFYTGVLDTSSGAPAGRYIWTRRLTSIGSTTAIASSGDGVQLAGASFGTTIFTSTLFSTIGTTGFVTGDYGASIELQYVGGGRWVPISSIGPIKFF